MRAFINKCTFQRCDRLLIKRSVTGGGRGAIARSFFQLLCQMRRISQILVYLFVNEVILDSGGGQAELP
jgi:hypothetical protein